MTRQRNVVLSKGHNPPRYVDREIPTFEQGIFADGGPGKVFVGAQGSNPWILGSMYIGSNHVFNILQTKFQSGSPNVWFKLRLNRSGSSATQQGGTIDSWFLQQPGRQLDVGDVDTPLRSIRGPGTLFLYGFGGGSVSGTTSNRIHKTLGTQANLRYSGLIRGHVV